VNAGVAETLHSPARSGKRGGLWSLAARIGRPTAIRAAGAANGANPVSIVIPCHRVIGSNGTLTGFGGGLPAKRWLLDHEARVAGHKLF